MDELPVGVVTFLFTDIQGSTRLLERLGDRYGAVRSGHDAIVGTSIAGERGRVMDVAGDGFFAVFPTPQRAARAAVRAQRELAAADWPDGVTVAVRMGLHTGEGVLDGSRYVGLEVHRAARIAAAAHGGQILVSDATRVLLADALPPGTSVQDLGVHRLKDLTRPERIHQLTVGGLAQDFPPPRTVDSRPGNLPTRLAALVGRQELVAQLRDLLREHRLVTLTGPGGTGKTRLALELAAEVATDFADGAFLVDLSAIGDPALVPAAVAAALALAEEPGRAVAEVLTSNVRHKQLLLVMDNFEQVSDAATFVGDVLAAAPGVHVVATSRMPLHLYGEQEFAVPPLGLPDPGTRADPQVLLGYEAVRLFVQRASGARADFRLTEENAGAVAEITRRLDGLPLAIELAAGRVKLFPPRQLLSRLDRRLHVLTASDRDVPERQRTLRAALDWSYDLLPQAGQRLFRRLGVFAGGADLEAVVAVADPRGELGDPLDLLTTLVDVNLVGSPDGSGDEPRFSMLETMRAYALDRLSDSGEEPVVRRRHAEYWLGVAERSAAPLGGADRASWLRRLDRDLDNLRGALDWSVSSRATALGLRLAVALGDYWRLASHVREGVHRLTGLLALDEAAERTPARAGALSVLSGLHGWIDDPVRMAATAEEALSIYRELDDHRGSADALESVGWAQLQLGRLASARTHLTEAIDRHLALGDPRRAAAAMPALGIIAQMEGDLPQARDRYETAADALRAVDDAFMLAMIEFMIGGLDSKEGDVEAAVRRYDAGLSGYLGIDNAMGVSWGLYAFAHLALEEGRPELALTLIGASDHLRGGTELPALITTTLGDVAELARQRLDDRAADAAYRHGYDMSTAEAVAHARRRRRDGRAAQPSATG